MKKTNNVGDIIQQLRDDFGLSQEQLADKLNIKVEVLKSWENNDVMPTQNELKELSKVLSKLDSKPPITFREYLKSNWGKIGYYFLLLGIIGELYLVWNVYSNPLTHTTVMWGLMTVFFVVIVLSILIIVNQRKK